MDTPEPFWMKYMGAGLALSILLHLVAGYLLVHGIEASRTLPAIREEPVEVTMVSPEELAEAEEKAAEEEVAREDEQPEAPPPPEEQSPEEQSPEDRKDEQASPETPEAEETARDAVPEPEPEAEPEAVPEPGAPEVREDEQTPEEPASEEAAEDQPAADEPAASPLSPGAEAPLRQDMRVFQPVTEFGEEDSGNRELDGGNTQDAPANGEGEAAGEPAEQADDGSAEAADETPAEAEDMPEGPENADAPENADTPEASAPEVLETGPSDSDTDMIGMPDGEPGTAASGVPREKPADIAEIAARARVAPAQATRTQAVPDDQLPPGVSVPGSGIGPSGGRLFSHALSNDPRVRTAMRGMPHAARADLLCMTELRGQLRIATPSYNPDILPSFRLREGNVLQPRRAAFRAAGQWYELSFRCELNEQITRVERFSFRVGAPIPRSQWRERGFPLN
ncbi:DUF930 domain-containing protein [Stappia sp.]|uniref:DUF930 domain-containing protein n=1 Tax=Stappia sp. TaxID=1870903 RepID=UPI0025CF718B|nr:DUF930 domain-containing protein [Stappia sp.]